MNQPHFGMRIATELGAVGEPEPWLLPDLRDRDAGLGLFFGRVALARCGSSEKNRPMSEVSAYHQGGVVMERLLSLNVSDVMCREVVQVSVHDTIEQAAATFAKHEVSGAPVVDETGRCVGVLTSGDFVRREALRAASTTEPLADTDHQLAGGRGDEPLHIEVAPEDVVSHYMSSAVQTVAVDALLVTAARVMDSEHIHRLIVVDVKGFPVGLLSSMDVVAAVINSVDEMLAAASHP